jgi:hypothetical protein
LYSRSYVARLAAAQLDLRSGFSSSEPLPPDTIISTVARAEAVGKGCRQREFFKKLDKCSIDEACLYASAASRSGAAPEQWGARFAASVAALRTTFKDVSPSHTVVVEAAVFHLQKGLLNVKGTHHVNVKQARALITYAVWLQHYKSDEWIRDGKLSEAPWIPEYEQFIHILIGGAGTGKTTTLRCIDDLVDFSMGQGASVCPLRRIPQRGSCLVTPCMRSINYLAGRCSVAVGGCPIACYALIGGAGHQR